MVIKMSEEYYVTLTVWVEEKNKTVARHKVVESLPDSVDLRDIEVDTV